MKSKTVKVNRKTFVKTIRSVAYVHPIPAPEKKTITVSVTHSVKTIRVPYQITPASISLNQLLDRYGWNIHRLRRHYRTICLDANKTTPPGLARYSLANVEAVEQSKAFQRDKKRKERAEAWDKANPEAAAKANALFKQILG
jgi:hypothetical protein